MRILLFQFDRCSVLVAGRLRGGSVRKRREKYNFNVMLKIFRRRSIKSAFICVHLRLNVYKVSEVAL